MALSLNGTSGISGIDGSAATPAIQGSDTNTGISFGTDTVNINTGGTTRATVDSSGRLLVGTTSAFSAGSVTQITKTGAANGSQTDALVINNDNSNQNDNLETSIAFVRSGNSASNIYTRLSSIRIGTHDTDFRVSVNSGGTLTERMRLDSSGRLLVGTSTARSNLSYYGNTYTPQQQIEASGSSYNNGVSLINYSASGYGSLLTFGISKSNTKGTNTSVANGDELGSLHWVGNDGTNFVTAAVIRAEVDGAPGTNDMPGRLMFFTTADGASTPTERMRISRDGDTRTFGDTWGFYSLSAASAGTSYALYTGRYNASTVNNGTNCFVVYTNGNVQNANNSYGALSDIKLKENIVNASSQWDDIKALQVRKYNFKEGQTHTQIGLIAQEAELVSPGLVTESPDRDDEGNDLGTVTKSVNYSVLYMKAVKALQEAMERIETLETRVAQLEGGAS